MVIPARNEAAGLEAAVRSVLATDYDGPLEVIVVDDRSTDETPAIAARLAAEDPRVRPVRGADLPPGWCGKPWACVQGYRAARGEILVFTDADTRHAPGLLAHALGALEAERADLLSITARQRCETFWERLVMPQIWMLLALRYPPGTVNGSPRIRDAVANGQFVMATREAYEAAGTHEAVRDEVVEDIALAQRFRRAGRKCWLAYGEALLETRMYRGLRHLIEGWSKNLYLGARLSFPDEPVLRALAPLLTAGVMLFWIAPAAMLALGPRPAGLAAYGLGAAFWGLASAAMRIPPLYALGYPLGAAVGLYLVLRSTWRGSRRVEWKGRTYRSAPAAAQD